MKLADDTPPRTRTTTVLVSEGSSYEDAAEHAAFVNALTQAKIPHTVQARDGKPTVVWMADQSTRVEEVRTRLFGAPLPTGRHLGADPTLQARFEAWLTERSIPYRIQQSHGRPFIVWDEKDTAQVHTWPYFAPQHKQPATTP